MVTRQGDRDQRQGADALRRVRVLVLSAMLAALAVQAFAASRQDTDRMASRGLVAIDSLLAVPAAAAAVTSAEDLWRRLGDNPIYGWQIEGRLGLALLMAGRPAEALPHLENVVRLQPREAAYHRNLGAALLQLKRRGRALSEYRVAVELEPRSVDLHREFGQLLLSFGDTRQAARELHTARELCGGCPELDQPLASLYLLQRDFSRAVPVLRRLFARDPQPSGRKTLVGAMAKAGEDSALVGFVAGLAARERTLEEWRLLVEAEGRLGQAAQSRLAVDDLQAGAGDRLPRAARAAAPFWGQIALNLLAVGDCGQALIAAEQAIALDPENVVYHNNKVVLLTRLGRDAEARREWERLQARNAAADRQKN